MHIDACFTTSESFPMAIPTTCFLSIFDKTVIYLCPFAMLVSSILKFSTCSHGSSINLSITYRFTILPRRRESSFTYLPAADRLIPDFNNNSAYALNNNVNELPGAAHGASIVTTLPSLFFPLGTRACI